MRRRLRKKNWIEINGIMFARRRFFISSRRSINKLLEEEIYD
jgi:hypothetical protein